MSNTLQPNEILNPNQALFSTNERWELIYQSDGNLVLYDRSITPVPRATWNSRTYGTSAGHCVMQSDGNFVVYNAENHPVWDSHTYGLHEVTCHVQDDGNFVLYSHAAGVSPLAVWDAWTDNARHPAPPPQAIMRQIANNARAYQLPANSEIEVESLAAFPAGSETVTIACGGPNAVYYHTEGNPWGFGQNDNGDVSPGHTSTFKITAAIAFVPKVYLLASHGQTNCAVFYGPIKLAGFDPSSPENVIDFIKKTFN
jgi:hypothetical protein